MKKTVLNNDSEKEEKVEKKDNGFNREDSDRNSGSGYTQFTKDKRVRTRIKRVEKNPVAPRREQGEGQEERRSFNPNFTRDNKLRGNDQKERGNYNRRERPADKDFNSTDYNSDKPRGERKYTGGQKPQYKKFERGADNRKPYNNGKPKGKGSFKSPSYNSEDYPKFPQPKFDKAIRLNRYLAMAGISSRREADELIQSGAVSVNGVVVTELGTKVEPTDIVCFKDDVVRSEKKIYIVMNKPKGYVTTLDDPHAEKTVMDLLKNACKERIYPVGRLDKNSLGVLLITNDGDLTKKLTHPAYDKKKIYHVTLDKALTRADMEQIAEGITLEDGEIHADEISYVGDSKKDIGIEIHSGRNRIIRRIFDHLGYKVQKLDRVYFAGLTKKNLKRGAWRFLTAREVEALRNGMYE